jgi:hypothetical protein
VNTTSRVDTGGAAATRAQPHTDRREPDHRSCSCRRKMRQNHGETHGNVAPNSTTTLGR